MGNSAGILNCNIKSTYLTQKIGNNGDFWDKHPGPFKRYYIGSIYNEKNKTSEEMNSKNQIETSPLPHLY